MQKGATTILYRFDCGCKILLVLIINFNTKAEIAEAFLSLSKRVQIPLRSCHHRVTLALPSSPAASPVVAAVYGDTR